MDGAAMFILVVGLAISPRKLSDISENRDIWPVPSQDGAAIGVDLAEGFRSHSGPLEPEAESADAGKEVEDIHARRFDP